jgi:hypothetical protein
MELSEQILSLTSKMASIFCRLFEWLRTRFIFGPTSYRRISGNLWMLAATGC